MLLKDAKLVLIDFETTGSVEGFPNEPWQIGMARFENGHCTTELYESWLQVGERPFNPYAPGRHGEVREKLAAAPTLTGLMRHLESWLSGPLVAHNIATEKKVLRQAAPMHRFGPWVDTLKIARQAWPGLASYALDDIIPTLGLLPQLQHICPDRQPHDALYDACACGVFLEHLLIQPGWDRLQL